MHAGPQTIEAPHHGTPPIEETPSAQRYERAGRRRNEVRAAIRYRTAAAQTPGFRLSKAGQEPKTEGPEAPHDHENGPRKHAQERHAGFGFRQAAWSPPALSVQAT